MILPFLGGCFSLFVVARALFLGAAAADGEGITRKDDPIFFWSAIIAGCAIAGFLFFTAWQG